MVPRSTHTVHPCELGLVKDGAALGDALQGKGLGQLVQWVDLLLTAVVRMSRLFNGRRVEFCRGRLAFAARVAQIYHGICCSKSKRFAIVLEDYSVRVCSNDVASELSLTTTWQCCMCCLF